MNVQHIDDEASPQGATPCVEELMYTWQRLEEEQLIGVPSMKLVQFINMIVLPLVMLKGRLSSSCTPSWTRSDVTQVLGKRGEGLITSCWIDELMDVIG